MTHTTTAGHLDSLEGFPYSYSLYTHMRIFCNNCPNCPTVQNVLKRGQLK